MKYVILLAFISITAVLQSQEYLRLIEPNKYLDVGHYSMGHICNYSDSHPPERNVYAGDTLIDGLTYAKLIEFEMTPTSGEPLPICPPFSIETTSQLQQFFIREDSLTQQVFKRWINSDDEELIFDYSLVQGEMLNGMEIDTIVQIVTPDGVTRRKFFTVDYPDESGYYIEGLGGNRGPFNIPFPNFEAQDFTMCIQVNGEVIFGNSCYDFSTGTESLENSDLSVCPNPVGNTLFISNLPEGLSFSFEIINSVGAIVKQGRDMGLKQEIDMSNLTNGSYLIRCRDEERVVFNQVILKNANQTE